MSENQQQQYKSVLKSTSLIGGSAFINILIGMIRTKFVAVLLGPTGVGLQNMYLTILQTVSTITGLGLNSSGVRSIAEANGQNDLERVARIVKTIRATIWISGIIGTLAVILLSGYLSEFTFNTQEHKVPLIILSIIVLLTNIQVGQTCILQGLRKIADIAKISIWGGVNGALISIPCFFLWGQNGIVPSLILTATASLTTSWYYAKKIRIENIELNQQDKNKELKELLNFGIPQMGVALLAAISAYLMRFIINNQFGLEGVGIWSAAFNISGVLANFVLNAMGTDYFPRLSAVANDNEKINSEVNTQLEIALLLAGPALVATILFAPLGIQILYTGKFDAAIPILRWSVYGVLGKVISWPLAFIIPAKGKGYLYFTTELLAHSSFLYITYLCSLKFGLIGTGIAMTINYAIYIIVITVIAKLISSIKIKLTNIILSIAVIIICLISNLTIFIKENIMNYSLIIIFFSGICYFFYKKLSTKTGWSIQNLKTKLTKKEV